MKKKSLLNFFIILLFVGTIFSQEKNLSVLTIPQSLKENANAVIRDFTLEVTIEDVDKMIVRKKSIITILNQAGNRFADIYESYDDDTKIVSLSAKIYDFMGQEIQKYTRKKFLDVSAVDGETLYSDARVKYVDYTPISYPYTVEVESEYKTSSTGFIPWWVPINGYYISVEKSSYVLKNLKSIPWRKKETSFENFNIEKIASATEIKYILKNHTAEKFESNTLPSRDMLPIAKVALNQFSLKGVIGEAHNWKEFGKWRYDFLKNGNDKVSEEIKSKVLELVKGVSDPIEKAKIIYKYVQNKTRYISVQEGIGGWKPIPANKVDEVGYGDCKGLTNYTKALLDVAGVKSHYSVVWAGKEKRNVEKDFFGMQGNHVILNIPNNGDNVWLECTSQTAPFGFLGDFTDDRDVLVITPEGGIIKHTSIYKNDHNLQTIDANIKLLANGDLKADLVRISFGTQYDDRFNSESLDTDELYKKYKTNDWNYLNNLEILSANLSNNKDSIKFSEKLEVSINKYASVNEHEYLFRVNVFNRNTYVPKRYRDRKLPLKISRGYKDEDNFTIEIPKGYHLSFIPEKKEIKTKFGTYSLEIEQITENKFIYKKSISIKEGVFPKEDYKLYRKFRKSIAKLENIRISITKKT